MVNAPLDPAQARPRASSLSCPSCGSAIALRTEGWSASVVCASCGSVLDATDPNLAVLQSQANRISVEPRLPLGSRGTWSGATWEAVGFQQVTITVDDTDYSWTEYVCFNPYRGFLYLSEYQGHWNVIEKLRRRPTENTSGARPVATFDGRTFKHFQTATAVSTFALGEFPWELRVGDSVIAKDYVDPPFILSAEASEGEVTWSLGTYTSSDLIRLAFRIDARFPSPSGVFANQPNPYSGLARSVGRTLLLFLAAFAVMLGLNVAFAGNTTAFEQAYVFDRADSTSNALVTPTFELTGRPSRVEVGLLADLRNDWVYFNLSLINEVTGEVRDFSAQMSYYAGRDSDGNWSEGGRREKVHLSSVPSGRYFLRIAPEGGEASGVAVNYTVTVKRDVPSYLFYLFAALALALPAVLALIPSASFEGRRWSESDYAPDTGSSDDDEEE